MLNKNSLRVNSKVMGFKLLEYYNLLICFTVMLVSLVFVIPASGLSGNEDTCFECHPALQKQIQGGKAHGPIKEGKCIVCHNPHTSKHQGLLNESQDKLCFKCHKNDSVYDFNKPIIHKPVENGKCLACHNPHSSTNSNLLIKEKGEICFLCHKKESIVSIKKSHPLVQKGDCVECHDPHTADYKGLIKKNHSELCSKCHKVKESRFITAHQGYSVEKSYCPSCHNLHSSDSENLLKASIHIPVAEKKCNVCHGETGSKNSLKLKIAGADLCYECHKNIVNDFKKVNNHQIANRENTCLNCHNPHASDTKNLLAENIEEVCFKCHIDTKRRMKAETIKTIHPQIENCSSCHQAHGSDNMLFLVAREGETCSSGKCHQTQVSFTHPTGPEVLDPRNQKEVNCLTCHDPMGTEYNYNLRLDPDKDLCEQCHNL